MSSATVTLSAPSLPRPAAGTRWIISRREDLIWFIGSAVGGYLARVRA